MNTILTDDEVEALELCSATKADVREVEAAVLAKLREQEPIYQYQMSGGSWIDQTRESYEYNLKNWTSEVRVVYAAPLPAVVQVPPLTEDQIKRHSMLAADCPGASAVILVSSLRRLLAAAPEAPAQPSVPAPWREAVKVAREAMVAVRINMRNNAPHLAGKSWGYLDAALAQLDALEGGE